MSILNNFWQGKYKLWKAFWLIGIFHAISLQYFIIFIEFNILGNEDIFFYFNYGNNNIPILNYKNLSILSKLITVFTTIFITVGIWRSAENYRGPFFIIVITLLYLSINNILPLPLLITSIIN
tara:strand:+ start:154 stop:522 length:369 start_codon:yes stop_codon:yes gene_type:complete